MGDTRLIDHQQTNGSELGLSMTKAGCTILCTIFMHIIYHLFGLPESEMLPAHVGQRDLRRL